MQANFAEETKKENSAIQFRNGRRLKFICLLLECPSQKINKIKQIRFFLNWFVFRQTKDVKILFKNLFILLWLSRRYHFVFETGRYSHKNKLTQILLCFHISYRTVRLHQRWAACFLQ